MCDRDMSVSHHDWTCTSWHVSTCTKQQTSRTVPMSSLCRTVGFVSQQQSKLTCMLSCKAECGASEAYSDDALTFSTCMRTSVYIMLLECRLKRTGMLLCSMLAVAQQWLAAVDAVYISTFVMLASSVAVLCCDVGLGLNSRVFSR